MLIATVSLIGRRIFRLAKSGSRSRSSFIDHSHSGKTAPHQTRTILSSVSSSRILFCRKTQSHSSARSSVSLSVDPTLSKDKIEEKKQVLRLRKMPGVQVRSVESESSMLIIIDMKVKENSDNVKTFNLRRPKSDMLESTFNRLRINLERKSKGKGKKRIRKSSKKQVPNASEATSPLEVEEEEGQVERSEDRINLEILHNGEPIDLSLTNEEAWVDGAVLKVNGNELLVQVNMPSVTLKKMSSVILSGFPVFADVDLEFTERTECKFYWRTMDAKHFIHWSFILSRGLAADLTDFVEGVTFTPTEDNVGQHLICFCIPRRGEKVGKHVGQISKHPITSGPGPCPFEKRHELTSSFAQDKQFRVVTYNLLARIYSDTELAKTSLFKHCPLSILDMDYRKHLLLKEIIGYHGDLLCLQEVDKSMFESHLSPALTVLGYQGFFLPKQGSVSEGCASFVRTDKFSVVKQVDIALSDFLKTDSSCADLWTEICKVETLKEKIEARSSILQVTVVQSTEDPNHLVCLANTHLYFHPTGCNIRLIHAAVALRHLHTVVAAYRQMGKTVGLVFCGDFNSSPHLGIYQLLTCQFVPSDHVDWSSGGAGELVSSLELSQPLAMESACGTPEYTNYTVGFQATLDYIYTACDTLRVCRSVPLPSHEDVTQHTALPNAVFPSDHLALVCELGFAS